MVPKNLRAQSKTSFSYLIHANTMLFSLYIFVFFPTFDLRHSLFHLTYANDSIYYRFMIVLHICRKKNYMTLTIINHKKFEPDNKSSNLNLAFL